MRLIDADNLIKAFEKAKEGCKHLHELLFFDGVMAITDGQPTVGGWIPCNERLPEAEKEVEVTVKRKYENKESVFTCRAIYENGEIWREDSSFCWEDFDNVVYDEEKDDWKVPEGWFEAVSYAEEFAVIDDFVIAWRELPEPYQEVNHESTSV